MTIDELRSRVLAAGLTVRTGDTVGERAAAMLVGRSPKTLRNWRSAGIGPEAEDAGRASYRLEAIWLYLVTRVDRRRRAA